MGNNRKIGIALAVTLVAIVVSFVLNGKDLRLGIDGVGAVAFIYAWRTNRLAKKGGPPMKRIREMARSRAHERGDEGLGVIDLMVSVVGFLLLTAMGAASLTGLLGMTALAACQADGQTIQTAMETFGAANGPTVAVTQAALLPATPGGNTAPPGIVGGPYLTVWPSNVGHYIYSISSTGQEMITVAPSTSPVLYTGLLNCSQVH